MKKYLINGTLALITGLFMVSCAETESDFIPVAEQKARAFNEVFKEIYGDIDPHQDWGFGSGKVEIDSNDSSQIVEVIDLDADVAYTRAASFGDMYTLLAFNTGTRAENKNLNEWGDPDKNNGTAYDVPDALTEGQKYRVRRYFQENPNLTYEDPHYTTFFIQQVYKGNPQTRGSLSAEEYTLGNGDKVTGSDYMDHLTVGLKADGTARDHVNDFNHGDWNYGKPYEVLNTGFSANQYQGSTTHVEGVTHPDKITLMVNSSTERVGFAESNASVQHNYCCALASAAAIDSWAARNGNPGEAVTDKWNRSFVGLDYEANEDPYYKENGNKVAAKVGDVFNAVSFAWTGTTYVYFDDALKNQTLKQYFHLDQEVYYLKTEKNNWAGTADNYSQQSDITKMNVSKSEIEAAGLSGANDQNTVLDLTKIKAKLDLHRIPVYGKGFQEWYYNIGARDYVFSDWIVTLTNAGSAPPPTYEYPVESIDEWEQVERGRVFCEDLGRATREDLDFNDVVFDAIIFRNHTKYTKWTEKYVNGVKVSSEIFEGPTEATKYYANVEILAAGGTIPITVNGYQVHSQFNPAADVVTMINTRDNNSIAYGSFDTRNSVQIGELTKNFKAKVDGEEQLFNVKLFEIVMPEDGKAIKTIKIISSFGEGTQVYELTGEKGGAPQKFMAPVGTKWTSERKNISLAYPGFDAWVKGGADPWSNVNINYIYNGTNNENGLRLPLVMKAQRSIITEGEQDLWTGNKKYEGNWSLDNLPLTLDLDRFYPGDRLRFYGKNIGDEAWITVVIGDITPYFIDSNFPNYVINSDGMKESKTTGCVEVLLDQTSADLLNTKVSDKKVTFQVQGRNFTLTRICRVLFQ